MTTSWEHVTATVLPSACIAIFSPPPGILLVRLCVILFNEELLKSGGKSLLAQLLMRQYIYTLYPKDILPLTLLSILSAKHSYLVEVN